PEIFEGVTDKLYRNRGDGTFEDVSAKAGIASEASNGLGVIVEDFDDDGWPDVFIANDGEANHLWMNQQNGRFREDALVLGVAVNGTGYVEASMGVTAGDIDADGDLDLFMTHLQNQSNTLYLRQGDWFVDGSNSSGLATPSLEYTGFGTLFFDIEHDGDLDLVIGNGRVTRGDPLTEVGTDALWNRYAEPNQVFLGDGDGKFRDVSKTESSFCGLVEITRALAVADLDADGDLDLVVANCGGSARIHENIAPKSGHWLVVRAFDKALHRDVYGAVVRVHAGGRVFRRTVGPGNSYLSSGMIAVHVGLGAVSAVDRIDVDWPGGTKETFQGGAVDRSLKLIRGEGKPR
ncbi:MAG: CRTAC1 family protein, partial [Planctomycetota bacterium]|nr:CRTAC1 family protein [Planctomycetota bacterium]